MGDAVRIGGRGRRRRTFVTPDLLCRGTRLVVLCELPHDIRKSFLRAAEEVLEVVLPGCGGVVGGLEEGGRCVGRRGHDREERREGDTRSTRQAGAEK